MSPDSNQSTASRAEPVTAEGLGIADAAKDQPGAVVAGAAIDDIVGYVDGVSSRRISGWAVNRARLDQRLTVRITLEGELIGEGLADRPRPDLERNGLGDGAYGFDIEPVRPLPHLDRIRIAATAVQANAEGTDEVPLENLIARKLATQAQGEGFSAVTTQLQQVLEESRTLQRRTDHALRLIAAELKDMRERSESAPHQPAVDAASAALPESIASIRETQAELARQLAEVGVIQARIDASLAGIQEGRGGTQAHGDDRALRRLVTVLTGVSGIALGLGVFSLFV